jgi:EAL domain-containing protein (putative c-di-GMP-specific phosphodiesterase class I)
MLRVDPQSLREGAAAAEPLLHLSAITNIGPALAAAEIGVWELDMQSGLAVWDSVTSAILGQPPEPQLDPRFEALLRWKDPRRGYQSPDTISAAFQDLNLAAEISDRMIDLVIADLRRWREEGVEVGHVAINAAAAEFRRGDFAESLLERLETASLPPRLIQLEVTETVFLGRGADYVERALKTLSAAGVKIALDDFGTGYASLSHLRQFPVDLLKIDRSFVREIEADADAAAIIRAVVNLGKSLEIETVAEGIETAAQHALLVEKGCDYGQGYFYSRAVSAAEVAERVAGRH